MAMSKQFHAALTAGYPRLRAYAIKLTRNLHDAEDLLQNTAVLALRAETQFTIGTNFTGWAYRIMRNSFLSGCRGNHRRPVSTEDVPMEFLSHFDNPDDRIMVKEATRAMDQLTPASRLLLNLIYRDGYSYEDASAATSCSVGTVKSRLWRGRMRLRELLNGDDTYGRAASIGRVAA
jgi:RNA polymerase sigma-70 factor (ECF subfamily)